MTLLATERLWLREFKEQDWEAVHLYACDPDVVRYMPWGPNTEDDTHHFVQRAIAYQRERPRRHYELALVLREEDLLIGGCGIRVSNPDLDEGNMGYCVNKDFWGRGYATEAAKALLRFGFETLNLHRIYAMCDPENRASARVLEKIGMSLEGRLRENLQIRGIWRDSLVYAILDHEWKKLRITTE